MLSQESSVPRLARRWELHTNLMQAGSLERVLRSRSWGNQKETKLRICLGEENSEENTAPSACHATPFPFGFRGPHPGWMQSPCPPPLPSHRPTAAGGWRGRGPGERGIIRGRKGAGPSVLSSTQRTQPAEPRGGEAADRTRTEFEFPTPPTLPSLGRLKTASELLSPPRQYRNGRGLGKERRSEGNK